MSRIGRKPITLPVGVKAQLGAAVIEVQGPKGQLSVPLPRGIRFEQKDGVLTAVREAEEYRALHGLARALVANAVRGVSEGFRKDLEIVGVGYRAEVKGKTVVFSLGYSHPIEFPLPEGVEAKAERLTTKGGIQQYQTTLTLSSIDKQKLGQVAAEMHKLRKPDAYKGKGIRYADVAIKLKPGKTGK